MTGSLGRWLAKRNAGQTEKSDIERIDWPSGKSPYPGLLSFDQEYAELFFGRDREVDAVIAKMSDPEGRFLIISGASGSGKSSVVGAGLWRELIREDRIAGSRTWEWLRIQPGDGKTTPFEALAWGLRTSLRINQRPEELADELATEQSGLGRLIAPKLTGDREIMLFVDQLEELFTRGFKDDDIGKFLTQLVATARDKKNRLRMVATVRSEFIARLEESESVLQLLNAGYNYHLGPVSPRVLQDMIEKPARAAGYEFESSLVDDILHDAAQEPGNLPLVAYTLKQLFERRRARTFTRDAYQEIEGVAGAIGTQADQVIAGLDAEALGAFDKVFAELVHIDRDRPPTRKRVTLAAFKADEGANKLINALAGPDCRVLVTGGEAREPSVEVAHEKLFTAWPKLSEWIDNGGDALRLIDYAAEAARRWQNNGDNPQELWLASRATEVLKSLQRFGKQASPVLDRFLQPQEVLIKQLEQKSLSHEQRARIGYNLAAFGDPRPGVGLRPDGLPRIEWVGIERGKVELEAVEKVFDVKRFRIAKYPVTNLQFEAFINAEDGYRNAVWWKGIKQSEGTAEARWKESNSPRETVSWYEAVAFCRWLTHKYLGNGLLKNNRQIRLPTEWEWQHAATGEDTKREYPWPGAWDASRCNSSESRLNRTTAVGMYPTGATRKGVQDMAGNVWEWCLNKYEQPETPESLRIDDTDAQRVIRGGSWDIDPVYLRSSTRLRGDAGTRFNVIGIRLAQDID
jgi:formylglycine-generating enzyme required for sulfatase activity